MAGIYTTASVVNVKSDFGSPHNIAKLVSDVN